MSADTFYLKQFAVRQDRTAMKVGTDGVLLGAWAEAPEKGRIDILDIGTGTGIVALMMAQRYPDAHVTAIDIDSEAAQQASENVASSPFAGRIEVSCIDVKALQGATFDAIVCNPPFFNNALLCPDPRRTASRHSTSLTLADVARAARLLLRQGGELSVILPTESQSAMESEAAIVGLCARRTCRVATKPGGRPKRVLLSWTLGLPETTSTEELTLNDQRHKQLLQPFIKGIDEEK